jgi:hypothetical protein
MEFKKNSLVYKIFAWWFRKTCGGNAPIYYNLCPLFRAVFLYAPLDLLFKYGRIGKVRLGCITWPLLIWGLLLLPWEFGDPEISIILLKTALGVIGISCLFLLIVWAGISLEDWSDTTTVFYRIKEKSVVKLAYGKFHSVHSKICPLVEFKD